jgi:hypothetical protein
MSGPDERVFYTSDRDVSCWPEQQSSVMLKAITEFGDPVELTATEARELASTLLRMADEVEN